MPTEIKKPLITKIKEKLFSDLGLELSMLRLDEIHAEVNGNKWYKLKYNLEACEREDKKMLVSCGGPFSNHIAALAAAGKLYGFSTGAVIRGEEHTPLNPTLAKAAELGMQFVYADRTTYRDKFKVQELAASHFGGDSFWIPEGGSNAWGLMGCMEILNTVEESPDCICCASGTGITVAGIAGSSKGRNKVWAFPALKGADFLKNAAEGWVGKTIASEINFVNDYHFGGYGKVTKELIDFVSFFKEKHDIQLDYIYNGKMMYGIYDLAGKGLFKQGSRILAVHSGGIQGNEGFAINKELLEIGE